MRQFYQKYDRDHAFVPNEAIAHFLGASMFLRFGCCVFSKYVIPLSLGLPNDYVSRMDKGMRGKAKLPTWVSSYNFLSLLNLPAAACYYGPPCNLWEGGYCGEGIIKLVKQELSGGFRDGWQVSLLERIYFNRQLENVGRDIRDLPKKQKMREYLGKQVD